MCNSTEHKRFFIWRRFLSTRRLLKYGAHYCMAANVFCFQENCRVPESLEKY